MSNTNDLHTAHCLNRRLSLFMGIMLLIAANICAAVSVLEGRNDRYRTGANTQETLLNTANVRPATFGLLYSYAVDGDIYAQPLYVPNVNTASGVRNVLYVATMNDVAYAFDADSNQTIWTRDFRDPARGITPSTRWDPLKNSDHGVAGIWSTPAIDATTQTMYLVTKTLEPTTPPSAQKAYVHRLYALDLATGADKTPPVVITATYKGVSLDQYRNNQRPGLALLNGQVIICFGLADPNDTHGWVLAYDAATLEQKSVFATTTLSGGGIWASGRAPAIDDNGKLIVFTGNGHRRVADGYDGVTNFVESVLRLDPANGLALMDWFTPDNWPTLEFGDLDLGGSGPTILPGTGYIVGGGKEGRMYVIDPNNMGKLQKGNPQLVQSWVGKGHIMGGPVIWDRTAAGGVLTLYHWGESDNLRAYRFNGHTFDLVNVKRGNYYIDQHPGGILSLSSNGTQAGTGIVWALGSQLGNAYLAPKQGILLAYDASDVSKPAIWTSRMQHSDDTLAFAKFTPPTVANGKVYVATFSNKVLAYGLLPTPRTKSQYVQFVSRVGGKYLEVAGGSQSPGSRVQLNAASGMSRQTWERTFFPDWTWRMKSVPAKLNLDIGPGQLAGNQVTLSNTDNPDTQGWGQFPTNNGYVKIVSKKTGLALTVSDPLGANGAAVLAMPQNGGVTQDWMVVLTYEAGITECDTSTVQIRGNSQYDVFPYLGLAANGVSVMTNVRQPNNTQNWNLSVPLDGYYRLQAASNSLLLDILDGGQSEGGPLVVNQANGALPQNWQIKASSTMISYGMVNIVSPVAGKQLTIGSLTSPNKAPPKVYQPTTANAPTQNWLIQDTNLRWCKP
ncbi:MAG: RICIN domain-containing protein [Candidatus Methylumidiphilus sp.]